jgi:excisionase family DNA binding protein
MVTQAPQAEPEFLTAKQAAALTGLSLQTIYDKVKAGILPGRRVGGKKSRYVIPKASLLRYLEGDWSEAEGGAGR